MKTGLSSTEEQEEEEGQRENEEAQATLNAVRREEKKKEQREIDEAQARLNTARRKAKKVIKQKRLKEIFDEHSSPRNTGLINWLPKHSITGEKWEGIFKGKKVFKIDKGVYKYSLKVIDKELAKKTKVITERSFELAANRAESIIKSYLKK